MRWYIITYTIGIILGLAIAFYPDDHHGTIEDRRDEKPMIKPVESLNEVMKRQ